MFRNKSGHLGRITGLSLFVVLSLAPAIDAGNKFPDYPVRQAGEYAVTAERTGVTIGVQPVEDLKDQKTYFDVELTPKSFIPVFIVIQNATGSDSFLFQKTNIGYGGVSNNPTLNIRSKVGDTMAYLGPGLIAMNPGFHLAERGRSCGSDGRAVGSKETTNQMTSVVYQ